MQVVAAAAMEAPSRGDPLTVKDSQVALFHSVVEADPAHYVRGQYDGYTGIDGVAEDSATETYAAMRLEIENWRWAGVPFFIRTGKRLAVTQTELRLVFKRPPPLGFGLMGSQTEANQVVVKLDPSTGVRLILDARRTDISAWRPHRPGRRTPCRGRSGPGREVGAPCVQDHPDPRRRVQLDDDLVRFGLRSHDPRSPAEGDA